jgi:lysine/ornithine N-monooxygenase
VKGAASSITGSDGDFRVSLACGSPAVRSRSVVLALGVPGAAMVPEALRGLPPSLCFHSDEKLGGRLSELRGKGSVLVIGGGLTAVQVAQLAVKRGCSKVGSTSGASENA